MSIFAQPPAGGRGGLFEMQCGKATLAGTTVTADPRKGILRLGLVLVLGSGLGLG